jgi:hypothetical protein
MAACGFLSISNVPGISAAQAPGDQSTQGQLQKSPSAPSAPPQNTPRDSLEPFVIERFLTRAAFQQDGSSRIDREAVVHVLTESGVQQFGQLVFGYNSTNQKIEIVSVEVRKAGSSTFASASAVRDVSPIGAGGAHLYSDYREKRVTVAGLHAGDTLAYHIASITTIPDAPGQFWFEHSFLKEPAALDEQLEISVPLQRAIHVPGFRFVKDPQCISCQREQWRGRPIPLNEFGLCLNCAAVQETKCVQVVETRS